MKTFLFSRVVTMNFLEVQVGSTIFTLLQLCGNMYLFLWDFSLFVYMETSWYFISIMVDLVWNMLLYLLVADTLWNYLSSLLKMYGDFCPHDNIHPLMFMTSTIRYNVILGGETTEGVLLGFRVKVPFIMMPCQYRIIKCWNVPMSGLSSELGRAL